MSALSTIFPIYGCFQTTPNNSKQNGPIIFLYYLHTNWHLEFSLDLQTTIVTLVMPQVTLSCRLSRPSGMNPIDGSRPIETPALGPLDYYCITQQ